MKKKCPECDVPLKDHGKCPHGELDIHDCIKCAAGVVTILHFKVGEEPKPLDIEPSLEEMQKLVGNGYIEFVALARSTGGNYMAVVNEDGLLQRLPRNRTYIVTGWKIVGDFFITCVKNDEHISLSDSEITRLKEYFK